MGVMILYQIPGVPLLNQLSEPTIDGRPDENARMNCVLASNAAYLTAVLGKRYYGDQLKDAVYGEAYTGGASEARVAPVIAKLGVTATRRPSSTQQGLLDTIHTEVIRNHGVIVTMPSQWDSAVAAAGARWNPRTYSGPSHVGLAYGVGNDAIRVMNPWRGFNHDGTDAYWAQRLLDGEVWVLEQTGAKTVIDLTTPGVAAFFAQASTSSNNQPDWLCKTTGAIVRGGAMQQFYRAFGGDALCGLSYLGLPLASEQPMPGLPGVVFLPCEMGALVYDPQHAFDSRPGLTGSVYLAHINAGPVAEWYAKNLTSALQAQLAAAKAQATTLQAQLDGANAALKNSASAIALYNAVRAAVTA